MEGTTNSSTHQASNPPDRPAGKSSLQPRRIRPNADDFGLRESGKSAPLSPIYEKKTSDNNHPHFPFPTPPLQQNSPTLRVPYAFFSESCIFRTRQFVSGFPAASYSGQYCFQTRSILRQAVNSRRIRTLDDTVGTRNSGKIRFSRSHLRDGIVRRQGIPTSRFQPPLYEKILDSSSPQRRPSPGLAYSGPNNRPRFLRTSYSDQFCFQASMSFVKPVPVQAGGRERISDTFRSMSSDKAKQADRQKILELWKSAENSSRKGTFRPPVNNSQRPSN